MRISTVRQLSRTLGTLLAASTKNSAEAQGLLKEIEDHKPKVNDYATLLNMTVGAIFNAADFNASTAAVVRAWQGLAREYDVKNPLLILALVAVTRDSCTEMLQALLSKPAVGNVNQTMDGSIKTVFGVAGQVSTIEIKVLNGAFARAFMKALREAESSYQSQKEQLQAAGKKPPPLLPEIAQITLTLDNSYRQPNQVHVFKASSADFIQAYIAATFDYAAGAYADRVRNGSA